MTEPRQENYDLNIPAGKVNYTLAMISYRKFLRSKKIERDMNFVLADSIRVTFARINDKKRKIEQW